MPVQVFPLTVTPLTVTFCLQPKFRSPYIKNHWLEWHSITVTLFPRPKGVTVSRQTSTELPDGLLIAPSPQRDVHTVKIGYCDECEWVCDSSNSQLLFHTITAKCYKSFTVTLLPPKKVSKYPIITAKSYSLAPHYTTCLACKMHCDRVVNGARDMVARWL